MVTRARRRSGASVGDLDAADGLRAGARYVCVACPYCHMQFDRVQQMMASSPENNGSLPSIVYPQLLGLAMGLEGSSLGIGMNLLDISGIDAFFG